MINYQDICLKTVEIARNTGKFIKSEQEKLKNSDIEVKGIHNFVTHVDKYAEKQLVKGLLKVLPESGFIVEEETISKSGAHYTWIIDPLDGTTNYIHGLSPFAISIALQHDNETVVGVVYEISLDECFYTWKSGKAYLNGKEISVTQTNKVKDSLIATGFPYYDYHLLDKFMLSLRFFMENSHGVRRIGSAATDLAYVACGRFESFYEYSLSPWDVAAGAFLVQNAGGKVSDFKGGQNYIFGKEIVASNSNVFDEFFNILNKILV